MKKLLFTVFTILGGYLIAQDIHFSQVYMTPMELNPANAGTEYNIRAILNYRTQWSSVTTPYVSMMGSYDMNFKKRASKTGFWAGGIFFYNDKAGDSKLTQNHANLAMAYHVYLNDKSTLGVGAQAGYLQRSTSTDNLQWGSQYDGYAYNPNLSTGENLSGTYVVGAPDFATGLTYTYRNGEKYMTGNNQLLVIAGLSVQHLNKPQYDYQNIVNDPLYYRWVGHVNTMIGIPNSSVSLAPNLVYLHQGSLNEILAGTNFIYKIKESSKYTGNMKGASAGIGVFYRVKDAFVVTGILEIANYTFGVSYDLNTSDLNQASKSYGAFEISLRYAYPNPFGSSKARARFK